MNMENTYEKLQRLMNSYVPEFAYKKDGSDPGSVLSNLCGGMLDECAKRYDRVIPKHRIQYLNMFDSLLKEPVSASKGYVQFHPVAWYILRQDLFQSNPRKGPLYLYHIQDDSKQL